MAGILAPPLCSAPPAQQALANLPQPPPLCPACCSLCDNGVGNERAIEEWCWRQGGLRRGRVFQQGGIERFLGLVWDALCPLVNKSSDVIKQSRYSLHTVCWDLLLYHIFSHPAR